MISSRCVVIAFLQVQCFRCSQLHSPVQKVAGGALFSVKSQIASLKHAPSSRESEDALIGTAGREVSPAPRSSMDGAKALLQEVVHQSRASSWKRQEGDDIGGTWITRILLQFLFGFIYYFLIVSKYPKLDVFQPTPEAIKLQSENEVMATLQASWTNCFFSWCCSGPRAAHTFHSTDVLGYWSGCILMSLFPCCTLWVVNSCTDLNERLGGVKKNPCSGLLCAFCCSCCIIAQDAESLDLITGARTNLCGVETNVQRPQSNTFV